MYQSINTAQKYSIITVGYVRSSLSRQNSETQRAMLKKYAHDNGLILTDDMIYEEKKPASNTKNSPMVNDIDIAFKNRPVIHEILKMASRHEFTHFITYSSDRLARDVFQNAVIKQHFKKNNISIHFTKAGENFKEDSQSQKLQNLLACYAEYEASLLSSRIFDNHTQIFQKGNWTGGKAPFAYKFSRNATGTILEKDMTMASAAKAAYDYYANGYGYRTIANMLSKDYFPYKFNKSTIEYILANEIYFGIQTWGKRGGRRKNRIVNDNCFVSKYNSDIDIVGVNNKNIIQLLRKNKSTLNDSQYFTSPFILKDLLICSKCGEKLIPKNYGKNKASVYRCPTMEKATSVNAKPKSHNIIIAKLIEDLVCEKLGDINYIRNDIAKGYDRYISSFNENLRSYKDIDKDLDNKILTLKQYIVNVEEMLQASPKKRLSDELLKYKKYYEDEISLFTRQSNQNKQLIESIPMKFEEFINQFYELKDKIPNKRIFCFSVIDKILVFNDQGKLSVDIIISPKI
jgi:site-specific DNA recombinase